MAKSAAWSLLPSDLVNRVADCFLTTNDLDYYMDLRAVCGAWRHATAGTRNSPDPRFRPSLWVVIDEVNNPVDFHHRTRLLVNTTTGRVLRKDLPLLRRYFVVATTPDGFFVLADRDPPHVACILNPFTGYLVRFMAPMVTEEVADADSACFAVCEDDKQRYSYKRLGVLGLIYTGDNVSNMVFDLMRSLAVHPSEMLAVHPSDEETGHTNRCFLVESAGELLIIIKLEQRMDVFRTDTGRNVFEPVKSIGNRAIFLGYRQCLSVNADKFPSVDANCIYYLKNHDLGSPCDIYMYDLEDEKEERVSGAINAINRVFLLDATRPFTIIQLLSSYTINAWDSELVTAKMFEGLSGFVPDAEELSSYLEDFEFDD